MQRHQNTGFDFLTQDIRILGWCPMMSVLPDGKKASLQPQLASILVIVQQEKYLMAYGVDVLLRQPASHSSSPTGLVTTESEALNHLRLTQEDECWWQL